MLTPLLLSLRVAGLATLFAIVFGVAIAALLTRRHSAPANVADAVVNLPLVLPPTVLGYYLLVLLGARSPLGAWLESVGIELVFTWQGAVVAASIVALPLVVGSTRAALEAVDPDLRELGHIHISRGKYPRPHTDSASRHLRLGSGRGPGFRQSPGLTAHPGGGRTTREHAISRERSGRKEDA